MSTTEVQLTVFLFGANLPARPEHLIQGGVARVDGIRVELELRPRMPARITNPMERNMWMQDLLARVGIVRDLKHSHDWGCTYCAKPARESTVQVGSWMNQNPPKMAIWVRCLCTTDPGPCLTYNQAVECATGEKIGVPPGAPGNTSASLPRYPEDVVYPLLAACVACEDDNTAGPGVGKKGDLKRCSGCHVTSDKCQGSDWKRHKIACQSIKSVNWVL